MVYLTKHTQRHTFTHTYNRGGFKKKDLSIRYKKGKLITDALLIRMKQTELQQVKFNRVKMASQR